MNSLILELQTEAMNSSVHITDLLRKASLAARKLGVTVFYDWCRNELNGYKDNDEIPEYREVTGEIKAYNPYNGWIPVMFEDVNLAKKLRKRKIGQAIGSLIELQRSESHVLVIPFPPEIEQKYLHTREQHLNFDTKLHIGSNIIAGIIDSVRNTILDWALKLEEQGVLGEGVTFSKEEKHKAQSAPNINIANFQGVLGDVTDSNITQNLNMNIQKNDFESLSEYLRNQGVNEKDIQELQVAINEDNPPKTPEKLGKKVSGWIGNMVSKAASGLWQIEVSAAGTLLAAAIKAYYGL